MKKSRLLILFLLLTLMIPHAGAASSMDTCNIRDTVRGNCVLTHQSDGSAGTFTYDVPEDGLTMLILFSSSCGNSAQVLNALSGSPLMTDNRIERVAVDCSYNDRATIQSFLDTYLGAAADTFTIWRGGFNMVWDYVSAVYGANSVTFPMVMLITGNETETAVRRVSIGYQPLEVYTDAVDSLLGSSGGSDPTPPSQANFSYFVENGGAVISGATDFSPALVIPSTIDGYPVKKIGHAAFQNNYLLESVVIPEGVTHIGENCFNGCSNLRRVELPASVTSLYNSAFYFCENLEHIEVAPGGTQIKSVDGVLFRDGGKQLVCYPPAKDTKHYVVPEGVTSIGYRAFIECDLLEEVTLPASLEACSKTSFFRCMYLKKFHLAANNPALACVDGVVYTKDMSVCLACPSRMEGAVTIPSGVKEIANYAFQNCGYMTEIHMPDTVNVIGEYAFEQCLLLKQVALPAQLTEIKGAAFYFCYNLTAMILPESLERLGYNCFAQTAITNYFFHGNAPALPDSTTVPFPSATVHYRPNTTGWDAQPWSSCNLAQWDGVHFPLISGTAYDYDGTAHPWQFDRTTGTLYFNGSDLRYYMQYSHGDWEEHSGWIRHIVTGAQTTNISPASLGCYSNLQKLTLSAGVTSVPDTAFNSCHTPFSVEVEAGNDRFYTQDGLLFTADHFLLYAGGLDGATSYTVPNHARGIGYYAFASTKLERLTLPSAMDTSFMGLRLPTLKEISISSSRFTVRDNILYDKRLQEVIFCPNGKTGSLDMPDTVTFIGVRSFAYSSLSEITLSEKLGTIAQYAFQYSPNLEKIVIPGSVSHIGQESFSNCTALKEFIVEEGVPSIGQSALRDCTALERVVFPDTLTTMSNAVFLNCTSLWDVDLGDGLVTLPAYAFDGCSSLTSITLPKPLVTIEDYAFSDCTGLRSIYAACNSPAATSHIFRNCKTLPTIYYSNANPTWNFPLREWLDCPLKAWNFPERSDARLTADGLVIEFSGVCFPSPITVAFYDEHNKMLRCMNTVMEQGMLDPIALPKGTQNAKVFFLYNDYSPRSKALTAD